MVPDFVVAFVAEPDVLDMERIMPPGAEEFREGRRELGIDNPAHTAGFLCRGRGRTEDGVVVLGGGVLEAGGDILGLKVGEVAEDFLFGDARGEHLEHILDADPHAADARAAAALSGLDGNAVEEVGLLRRHGWRHVSA